MQSYLTQDHTTDEQYKNFMLWFNLLLVLFEIIDVFVFCSSSYITINQNNEKINTKFFQG